jgi:hypothetical protein
MYYYYYYVLLLLLFIKIITTDTNITTDTKDRSVYKYIQYAGNIENNLIKIVT